MVEDREQLFSYFMPKCWDVIHSRAWERTCLGFRLVPLIFAAVGFLVFAIVSSRFVDAATVMADVNRTLLNAAVWLLLFGVWYGVNLVRAVRDVYEEQQEKIRDLETVLAKPLLMIPARGDAAGTSTAQAVGQSISPTEPLSPGTLLEYIAVQDQSPSAKLTESLEEKLIQFRIDGVKLRNKQLAPDQLDGWNHRVTAWEDKVKTEIRGNPRVKQSFVARFITLKDVKRQRFSWACNSRHNRELQMLDQRIDTLLELMASL